jgi:hypothetical protein
MKLSDVVNSFGTVTAVVAFIVGLMTQLGCDPGVGDFHATCSIPFLPETWMPILAMVMGAGLFTMKLLRPGGPFRGLFGSTAVIVPADKVNALPNGSVGVVTPSQVAAG